MELFNYKVGDWDTEHRLRRGDGAELEIVSRKHYLTFRVEGLGRERFAPVTHTNAGEFLGVPPGLLRCDFVNVMRAVDYPTDTTAPAELMAATRDAARGDSWLLTYAFTEDASRSANTLLTPTGPGSGKAATFDALPPFDMAGFFGAAEFPVPG